MFRGTKGTACTFAAFVAGCGKPLEFRGRLCREGPDTVGAEDGPAVGSAAPLGSPGAYWAGPVGDYSMEEDCVSSRSGLSEAGSISARRRSTIRIKLLWRESIARVLFSIASESSCRRLTMRWF